jgi:hypothetical protein
MSFGHIDAINVMEVGEYNKRKANVVIWQDSKLELAQRVEILL